MIIKFPTAAESEAADRRHTRALTHALRAEMAAIQRAQAIVASRAFYGGDHLCSQCEQPITECVCYNVIVRSNDEPDGWVRSALACWPWLPPPPSSLLSFN